MPRFVEYFAIIGVNEETLTGINVDETLFPKILHVTPPKEWEDFSFPLGLHEFCFPDGCYSVSKCREPILFSNVLTNIDGSRYYCSILLFYERAGTIKKIYIPKSFVIVSKYSYISNYYDCLNAIFKSLRQDKVKMDTCIAENLISQIIYNNHSPEPGSAKFIISLIDNQSTIYPPLSNTIPATEDNVATLLELVGVNNLLKLYGALLLDNRIAFISNSYNCLYKCTQALISLAHPINYKYIYIPILPKFLIDFIGAPTPFVVGFKSSCEFDSLDLNDVLFMNLDTGRMTNKNLCSPYIPEPYSTHIHRLLADITHPNFFLTKKVNLKKPELRKRIIDKMIRACIFYLFLELISNYRQSITYARLIPSPILRFDQELFMSSRPANSHSFYTKFFKTTTFALFIAERANNYRVCDYFDKLINEYPDYKETDISIRKLINRISDHFLSNEPMSDSNKFINFEEITNRKDFKYLKISHPDSSKMIIPNFNIPVSVAPAKRRMRAVPFNLDMFKNEMNFNISNKQKEIIENFVYCLFEGEISETSEVVDCIRKFVSSKACIFSFIIEILKKKTNQETMVSAEQMITISGLFNAILSEDKNCACYCSAAQILKIAFNFFHSLGGKKQFLYTYLKHHEVWRDRIFWENYYFVEIQSSLLNLYRMRYSDYVSPTPIISQLKKKDFVTVIHPELVSALDMRNISVKFLSDYPLLSATDKIDAENAEINVLYTRTSQILIQICNLLVETDAINKPFEKENINDLGFKADKLDMIIKFTDFTNKFLSSVNEHTCLKNDKLMELKEFAKKEIEERVEDLGEKLLIK